jgi:hypothetical protein
MVRPEDQKLTAIEKIASVTIPKRRHSLPCRYTWGSICAVEETEEGKKNMSKGIYCGFHRKERARHNKQAKQV